MKTLGELLRELTEHGEKEFRERHPSSFLLVVDYPEDEYDDIDQVTVSTDVGRHPARQAPSPSNVSPKDLVVELVKVKKNIFKSKVTVGRASNNDIMLNAAKVSKLHCAFILKESGRVELVDLDSLNGTVLNNVQLDKDSPVPLKDGDQIVVWKYQFAFISQGALLGMLRNLKNRYGRPLQDE